MLKLKHYCLFFYIAIFLSVARASDKKITAQQQQQYLTHIYKARLYLADSLYQKACDEYKTAFTYRKDYVTDLFECTKVYDKLDNTEKTLKYLKMSIEAGCDYWNYNDGQYLPNLKRINKLPAVSDVKQLRKTYYQNLDIDYLLELEKLVAGDQAIRHIKDRNTRNTLIGTIDSANMVAFKGLVEKYGFPEMGTAGLHGVEDAIVLLMHSYGDSLNWVYFQPILLNEVKNGQLMPEWYALLYDRVISHNGKGKQCYGEQMGAPIDDIENVDIRRKEIGLMPLGDDLKISGGKAPDGYIRK